MGLKDLLKKRDKTREDAKPAHTSVPEHPPPNITFMRSDTNTQELIQPPTFASHSSPDNTEDSHDSSKRLSRFRSPSNASTVSKASSKGEKRLSARLHIRSRSRDSSAHSTNIPADLPVINDGDDENEDKEAKWEERATILAQQNAATRSRSVTLEDAKPGASKIARAQENDKSRPTSVINLSDAQGDENIQEAIRLHESGDLAQSTAMFGRLADSNAMAQILYGLALRHGWGIPINTSLAITYLSQAASNSAAIEAEALSAGMKKGGAAKGELVLAMYELANSFQHGWGVDKDPAAARSYYETAANLGDTDAMNEVARCYEVGFGGKKDKYMAAKYYRLAEEHGNKTLGNSWIWKDKYAPKEPK